MKVLQVLLILACLESTPGFLVRPTLPILTTSLSPHASSTALHMGLGSFVKKRLGRGSKDDSNKKKAETKQARRPTKAAVTKKPQPTKTPLPRKPTASVAKPKREVAAGIIIPPNERDDGIKIPSHESATDRIRRTQAGKMTEAEKQAFLMTSLGQKAEPMFQPNSNATPLPRDSILKQVMTGKKDVTSDMVQEMERQKEDYFNMVTDPNRFKSFEASASQTKSAPKDSSTAQPPPMPDDSSTAQPPPMPNDLGSRLEAAAITHENQQRELRKQVEAQRQETIRRNQEIAQERNEQIARQEEAALKKRKELEAIRAAEEAERARVEAEKKAELQRRQDEYWKKQLEIEKQLKVKSIVEEAEVADTEVDVPVVDEAVEKSLDATEPEPQEIVQEAVTPRGPAPPKTFVEQQAEKRKIIERQHEAQMAKLKALNSPLPTGPPKGLVAAPAVPPVIDTGLQRSITPVYNDVRSSVQPQAPPQPVVNDISPSTVPRAPAPAPRLDLRTLVGQSQVTNAPSQPAVQQPAQQQPAQPAPRADLLTLMSQRAQMDAGEDVAGDEVVPADEKPIVPVTANEKPIVPVPADVKPIVPVDLVGLMRQRAAEDAGKESLEPKASSSGFLGRVFGGGNKQRSEPVVEEEEPEIPVEVPAPQQQKQPKKPPIRQKLNFNGEDDDVDFEAAWNARSANAASASDEDKSKMYGIDISKYGTMDDDKTVRDVM